MRQLLKPIDANWRKWGTLRPRVRQCVSASVPIGTAHTCRRAVWDSGWARRSRNWGVANRRKKVRTRMHPNKLHKRLPCAAGGCNCRPTISRPGWRRRGRGGRGGRNGEHGKGEVKPWHSYVVVNRTALSRTRLSRPTVKAARCGSACWQIWGRIRPSMARYANGGSGSHYGNGWSMAWPAHRVMLMGAFAATAGKRTSGPSLGWRVGAPRSPASRPFLRGVILLTLRPRRCRGHGQIDHDDD